MANRLVIRYYPVDGEWSPARSNPGDFGIAVYLPPVTGQWGDRPYTMGAEGQMDWDAVKFTDYWAWEGHYLSTVHFSPYGDNDDGSDAIDEGGYVEQEVTLLESDGVTVRPIDKSTLPLDVIIAGLGSAPYLDGGAWRTDIRAKASYAGGVVEIGLYADDEYLSLTTFWVRGTYFTPKPGDESWANPALPPQSGSVWFDEEAGLLYATLDADIPSQPFWTGFLRTVERDVAASLPEPEPDGTVVDVPITDAALSPKSNTTGSAVPKVVSPHRP